MSNIPNMQHSNELADTEASHRSGQSQSATPKPRAGEQFRRTPDVIAQLEAEKAALRDRFETLIATADRLITERDLLRERERALVDVLGKLLDVTKRANIEVPMSDAPVFFAARDLLAKHGR